MGFLVFMLVLAAWNTACFFIWGTDYSLFFAGLSAGAAPWDLMAD